MTLRDNGASTPWLAAEADLANVARDIALAPNGEKLHAFHEVALRIGQHFRNGFLPSFQDANDGLWDAAVSNDLIDDVGEDCVQHVLNEALEGRASVPSHARDQTDPPQNPVNGRALVIRRASDIPLEPIAWLWPARIAIGKLTLIVGEPGLGKSQFTAALAASITANEPFPLNEGRAPQGSVIMFSAEDGAADTIVPRLIAAGADTKRVLLASAVTDRDGAGRRTFNLQADLDLLEWHIQTIGAVRLVVIDPISAYLGKTDSHKNADLRSVLEPLADLAARLRVAVVAVSHFNKNGSSSAVNRVIGSIGFVAAARAAYMISKDPDDGDRRLFLPIKNNLGSDNGGLAFRIVQKLVEDDILASSIVWDSEKVIRTADEILSAAAGTGHRARDEASNFLRNILSDGPVWHREIKDAANGAGISLATIKRAKQTLMVKAERKAETGDGFGKDGRWYWSLPQCHEQC